MTIEEKDLSGTPRSPRDIFNALKCIEAEVVKNPTAMSKTGEPLLIHYVVIIDVLRAALAARVV